MKKLILGLKNKESMTSSTLIWVLRNLAGKLPDKEIVHNIIGNDITSIFRHPNGTTHWVLGQTIIEPKEPSLKLNLEE